MLPIQWWRTSDELYVRCARRLVADPFQANNGATGRRFNWLESPAGRASCRNAYLYEGLTTAAAIWAAAGPGATIGCGLWQMGLVGAGLTLLTLSGVKQVKRTVGERIIKRKQPKITAHEPQEIVESCK